MGGAEHGVGGAEHGVGGAQHDVGGAQHGVSGAQHGVGGAEHGVGGAQHGVGGAHLEVSRYVGSSKNAGGGREEDAKEYEEGPNARATGRLTTEPWHKIVQYSVT